MKHPRPLGSSECEPILTEVVICLYSQMEGDGAVVTPHGRVTNLAVAQAWEQSSREQEVVQAPAHVLAPCVHHVRPEGVGVGLLRIQLTEAIGKASGQELAETFALFRSEARILTVAFGVLQVNLLVGHVEVTTQHQGLATVQVAQVFAEIYIPRFTVVEANQTAPSVGHVCGNQKEGRELGSYHTALFVMLLFSCRRNERSG